MAPSPEPSRFEPPLTLEEKKRIERLGFLSELSRRSGEKFDSLLQFIVNQMPGLFDLEKCTLFLLEESSGELVAKASNAIPEEEWIQFRISLSDINNGINLETAPFISSDASSDLKMIQNYAEKAQIKSLLTIPLRTGEKFLGILHFVNSKEYHYFSGEEVDFIKAVAAEVALVLDAFLFAEEHRVRAEDLRLFQAEQEKAKQISLIYGAAKYISSPILLDRVLSEIGEQICSLAEVNRCFIFLLDEEREVLSCLHAQGVSEEQKEFFSALAVPLSYLEGETWQKFAKGKPLVLQGADCKDIKNPLGKLFALFGTQSCCLIPLLGEKKLIGFIYLDNAHEAHKFAESVIQLIMAVSLHASTALERAQLYKQLQDQAKQVRTLYQMSTALSASLDITRIYRLIVEKTSQLVPAERLCLFMWDGKLGAFVIAASRGISEESAKNAVVKIKNRFVGLAATRKKPVYTANVLLEIEDPPLARLLKQEGLGAVLAVPLISKGKTIGVLTLFMEIGHQFREKEIQLLSSFVNHATLCIENARVYNQNKQKVQELGILFDVGKRINEHLNPQEVLRLMAEQFLFVMNADGSSVMLFDKKEKTLTIQATRGVARKSELEKKIRVGQGIVGKVVKTLRPMFVHDEEQNSREFPRALREEGIKTILCVPLATKNETLGVVNLYTKEYRNYSASEMHLLATLAAQGAVALQNAKIFEEHYHVAQLLQKSLLPERIPQIKDLEFGVQYLSSQEISGDYYDFLELRGKLGITIADVSGKGTSAAVFTGQGKYAWKAYGSVETDPKQVLTLLNRLLVQNTPMEKFISLFYGILDLKRKEFVYSNAGHLPPLLYRAAGKQCRLLQAPGMLLGVDEDAEFVKKSVNLSPNDVLLLYTDGVTEMRNEDGEFFGMERLEKIFMENVHHAAQLIANRIVGEVRKFARHRLLNDDVTLVVMKIK